MCENWWRRKREGWSLSIVTVEEEGGGGCGMPGGRRRWGELIRWAEGVECWEEGGGRKWS